jgi:hypothetical protein
MSGNVRGALALALAAAGCGGGTGTANGALSEPLQPLVQGASWTYRTSAADGSNVEEKVSTVTGFEDVGGVQAAVVETRHTGKVSRVWLAEVDGRILRLREETVETNKPPERRRFEPGSLRTPATAEGLKVGQTLPSNYAEIVLDANDAELSRTERAPVWTVEALDDEVDTPAGRFGAVRLRRSGSESDGSADKRVWYAPGVGKVKEQGAKLEVLASYRGNP